MKTLYPEDWPQFFTATIVNWNELLKEDRYKDIVINSFRYLKNENRIKINAFVIMNNHIHLIWQALQGHILKDVQSSFAKHTAKAFLKFSAASFLPGLEIQSTTLSRRDGSRPGSIVSSRVC